MANFDLTLFDNPVDYAKTTEEFVMATPFQNEDLSSIHLLVDGIKVDREVPVYDRGFLMIGAAPGCDPTDTSVTMPTVTRKLWSPAEVGYRLPFCQADFGKFFNYMLAAGVRRADLTESQFWSWLTNYITENHIQELHRIIWFSDTAISASGSGGTLSSTAYKPFYNKFDGLFKRVYAANASYTDTYVEIAANTSSTQALSGTEAFNTFDALSVNAGIRLMSDVNGLSYKVTVSVYRALLSYLRGQAFDASFARIQQSNNTLYFDNIPIIPMPNWDVTIANNFTVAGVKDKPHRIVLCKSDNIPVGLDTSESLTEMDMWYSKEKRQAYIDCAFLIDTLIYKDTELMAAY